MGKSRQSFRLSKVGKERSLYSALRQIYGIGRSRAYEIAQSQNISDPESVRFNILPAETIRGIEVFIEANFNVGQDLYLETKASIRNELDMGSYRGIRQRRGLPVRGQRTHGNAQTQRHLAPSRLRG